MKSARTVVALAVLLGTALTAAPAANALDVTTDAGLCSQIGRNPYAGGSDYLILGQVDIPGAGPQANFGCGAEFPLDKPAFPSDGTPITVNTAPGPVALPCWWDTNVKPAPGARQFGYIGLPSDTFPWAPQNTWDERKAVWEAKQRSPYKTYVYFLATTPGTFQFTGEFTDAYGGGVKKCNLTVNVSSKTQTDSGTSAPKPSAKCTAAKKSLAAAKAKGTKKQVAAATKKVATACKG